MQWDWLSIALLVLLVIHVAAFASLVRNLRWLHWPREQRPTPLTDVAVTVVVPARNEAADIETCLRSLLQQQLRVLQVIVVNDHSTDATPEIIDQLVAEHPDRLLAIHNPPLRPGWLGKHNAMQSAWEQARGDYILLTDADVEYQADCVATAVAELEADELDLLSIYPSFEFHSLVEVMLLPIYVGGLAFLITPDIGNPRSRHAMAVGAFILVRKGVLEEIDGFDRFHAEILDDVMLARTVKHAGRRISLRSAPDLMRLRLFKNARHALFGFAKHVVGNVQWAPVLAIVLGLIPLAIYGALIAAIAYGSAAARWDVAGLSGMILVIHYASLLYSRPLNQFHPVKALAFPLVGAPFAVSCLWAAYQLMIQKRFQWRGRAAEVNRSSHSL